MGFLSWLTGTSTAKEVIGVVSEKLDAAVYTEQEKAEAGTRFNDWLLKYMEATNPQNVSRRLIAFIIVTLWAALIITAVISKGLGSDAFAAFVFQVIGENVDDPFLGVIGFYFLAHIVRANKK